MPQCEHNVVNSKGKFISGGLSGIVELLPSDLIIKSPWPGSLDSLIEIANEFEIYNHLGPHRRLVPVQYMPHGDLAHTLQDYFYELATTMRAVTLYKVVGQSSFKKHYMPMIKQDNVIRTSYMVKYCQARL